MNWKVLALIILVVAMNMWLGQDQDQPQARRPLPEPPQPPIDYGYFETPLPEPSSLDPKISVSLGEKKDSTGTAFALKPSGWWMTARHVVDGCSRIHLRFPNRKALNVEAVNSDTVTDLALLLTRGELVGLPVGNQELYIGQNGFFVGYPQGIPGEVWSMLIGRQRMHLSGRYHTNEPVLAWAEKSRHPGSLKSLGGLSGGPALDAASQVVGVVVAESRRRGRIYTAAPASMKRLLTDQREGKRLLSSITPDSLKSQADRLRDVPSVAQVVCFTKTY